MRTRPLMLAAIVALMWGVAPATNALAQAQASGDSQTVLIQQAPTGHQVAIQKEHIEKYFKDMDTRKLQTLRMLEGGKYNVNVRRITNAETALVHPKTIDLWVILEGSGTLTTGGTIQKGDVEFIPPTVAHGVSGVQGSLTWLNIRWDTDWK